MKNAKKYIFILVIVLSIAFIWSNSIKVGDSSMQQSNFVKELFISFFAFFGMNIENTFFIEFIRKFAHFFEYFVLGLELALFKNIYYKTSKKALYCLFSIGALVAIIDESIQLIPKLGRSGEFFDVCIDVLGVFIAFFVVFVVSKKIKRKINN